MEDENRGLRATVTNVVTALRDASQVIAYDTWVSSKADANRVAATFVQSNYVDESDGRRKWKFDASFSDSSWATVWRYGDYVIVSFAAITSATILPGKTRNIITNLPTCTKRIYLTPSLVTFTVSTIEEEHVYDWGVETETVTIRTPTAINQCVCAIRPEEFVEPTEAQPNGYYKNTILQVDASLNPTRIDPGRIIYATFSYITSDPLPT